ncbi:rRNA small subunit methyltransferase B [Pseudactinotalea sp. HY160]|uniref:RsmB/NOP family class I SAM-dependent RNA methyltransferase n=1 Tax=Pseudactinotalea sp. HY160 TaxID=2654490 RepID=UPI00128CC0C9|nr:RsmB/NOP family class I SAM-dependent RNA methyltransferase [Pseudactinotalea sp. HY160]MPV49323.1 rRNA small subunit methyltransferase B [Pseudactinotalea sp. HY160]
MSTQEFSKTGAVDVTGVRRATGVASAVGLIRSRRRAAEHAWAVDPARTTAYAALRAVVHGESFTEWVLPALMRRHGVYGGDAAWTTELTYGTLRLRGRYDRIIAIAAAGRLGEPDDEVLDVLRLGCHQLLAMQVPAGAAVSETVALAHAELGQARSQSVAAVLRRVAERDLDAWLERIEAAAASEDERLGRIHSHPQWIVRAFRQGLGAATEELTALLEANNAPAPITLAVRPGLVDLVDLPQTTRGRYAPTARVLQAGDPGALTMVKEGLVGVQDEGSQLLTLAFATAPITGPDRTWLDLCAGPGGTAALLASWLAARTGSPLHEEVPEPGEAEAGHGQDRRRRTRRLVANELFQQRSDQVRAALRAIPGSIDVTVRTGDGRLVGGHEPAAYDRVLVDAPCTGLGALRRHPEAKWRRSTADLARLAALQRELTLSAIAATRVGGMIGYLACSPHVAETRFVVSDVIKRAAAAGTPVAVVDAVEVLDRVAVTELADQQGPYVQLWPHRHGTDAVFLALLRRT